MPRGICAVITVAIKIKHFKPTIHSYAASMMTVFQMNDSSCFLEMD